MKIGLTFIPKAVSEKTSQLLSDLQVKVHKIAKCCFQALEKLFSWIGSAFSKCSRASIAPQKNQVRPAQTQQASNNVTSQEPLSAWKFPVTEEECASLPVVPFRFEDGTILVSPSNFYLILTHSTLLQAIVQSDNASGPLHFNKSSVNLSEFTRESFASALDILRNKHIFKQHIELGGVALLEHLSFEGTDLFALGPSLLLDEFEDEIKDSWHTTLPVSVSLTRQIISDLPNLACFLNIKKVTLPKCALPNGYAFLASLTHLEVLNLSDTNVADLSFLQHLTKLKTLNLSYCKQIQDFAVIGTLSHLEELNLKLTKIADLSFLQRLLELKTLDLYSCKQIQDFAVIEALSHLEVLNLESTEIVDLSFLQHLTELKTLDLSYCKQIQDFALIGTVSHLEKLYLVSTNVVDISFLQRLTKLKTLNLSYCKQIQDFAVIGALSHLEILDLRNTNVADISFLQRLTKLKTLDLERCKQIQNFAVIGTLSHLEILDLRNTNVADLSFLQRLPKPPTLFYR